MASSNLPLARAGGRLNTDTGMLLTSQDVDRIGSMALQSLLGFLAIALFDNIRDEPLSGFVRDSNTRNHCTVTQTGNLTFTINTGWGMFYDAAAAVDEFGIDRYRPIVVDTPINETLAAHDATNPRIDIVCLAPAWVDDQSASRNVKNPTTGVVTSTSVALRRRFGAAYQIVAGTPAANPSPPAVPAGYIEIARARVPASSGAAVWSDSRPPIQLGNFLLGLPARVVSPHVPMGDAGELLVSADSPASMAVQVAAGRADLDGIVRGYPQQRVAIAAADATNPRIDVVYADRTTNVIQVVTGTPAASPSVPALPTPGLQTPLAQVLVGAGVATITGGNITDVRVRQPFNGDQLQDDVIVDRHIAPQTRVFRQSALAIVSDPASPADYQLGEGATEDAYISASSSLTGFFPLQLPDGCTINSVRINGENVGTGVVIVVFQLYRVNRTTGVGTRLANINDTAVAAGTYELSQGAINEVVDNSTYAYVLRLRAGIGVPPAAAGDNHVYSVGVQVTTSQHLS